jgi:hypothetical protein
MPKPRPSMMKRQREQAKREKKAMKAERRAQRKDEAGDSTEPQTADVVETA